MLSLSRYSRRLVVTLQYFLGITMFSIVTENTRVYSADIMEREAMVRTTQMYLIWLTCNKFLAAIHVYVRCLVFCATSGVLALRSVSTFKVMVAQTLDV